MPFLRQTGCCSEGFSPPGLWEEVRIWYGGVPMIVKQTLFPERIRKIEGSFAFIEHRFMRNGFWESLNHHELLLYVFLVMVSDSKGLSYYGYDRICRILKIHLDEYIDARNGLIKKDLIGFDGRLFQVLSLPDRPVALIPKAVMEPRKAGFVSLAETIHDILRDKGYGIDQSC